MSKMGGLGHMSHAFSSFDTCIDEPETMIYIKELIMVLLLTIVVAGNTMDVIYDYREGASISHLGIELLLILASFTLIFMLSHGVWRQSRSNSRLKEELESHIGNESQRVPSAVMEARQGLAKVIQEQFEKWQLTQTEKSVAMLLLKGLSFKEIASVHSTMEKTVRQQASSIYKKANVTGRHSFAAWFIEDYL
jgi:DNA-binding CsgD family transcriptional regulator